MLYQGSIHYPVGKLVNYTKARNYISIEGKNAHAKKVEYLADL